MPAAAVSIQNTSDLRKMLIETINAVKSGEIDHKQARTIAAISNTILASAKLDLAYIRASLKNEIQTSPLNLISMK